VKGWVNLNLNEIKFACNSKYSKVNFSCMSFYEQIRFILQMLKYYGFSSFSVEDVNTMYQLINVNSIENTNEVGDILTKLNTDDIETKLYEDILLYGYKREYIEDSNIHFGRRLNYKERND